MNEQPGRDGAVVSDCTLADLGEWELIRRLARYAPPGQFDDDAALLDERSGRTLVLNTDVLAEGIHFSDVTSSAEDLGWRAAAVNLSDLAAMGCQEVVGLSVGLVAPASTRWRWVEGVYSGLSEALARFGGELLGGDCSGGDQRLLAITALGRLGPGGAIRRSAGRAGDTVVCTGPHGLSRLGLALLQEDPALTGEGMGPQLPLDLREAAVTAHRRPTPRLDVVEALRRCRPDDEPSRVGGTDSSDGLAAAVTAIARSSGCDAVLELSALPVAPAMRGLPQAEAWCLGGGEDFELVLSLAPAWAEALIETTPGVQRIGSLKPGQGSVHWLNDEAPSGWPFAGFTHFR
jgi:thiamine-monophosphate kinase